MLQMGSSKPWGEAMLKLTRGTIGETDRLSAAPLLAYFKPLQVNIAVTKQHLWSNLNQYVQFIYCSIFIAFIGGLFN